MSGLLGERPERNVFRRWFVFLLSVSAGDFDLEIHTISVLNSFYRCGNDYSYTRRKGIHTELGVLFLVLRAGLWGLVHSSSAFKVALFSGKTRVRSVVPSFIFLGLYNEQGKVMFIVLVSQKSIRTSNDYRPEKSSESFKRKDRCWKRPYHFQRLALFLQWDPESLVRLLASRDVTFDFEWLNGP